MTRTTHLYVSQRVNRRVKDAVGILCADVVFCTASAGTTPTASSAWQTTFDKLTKTAGLYVWSATKTMLTDGTVTYTGIYKLGKVEELMDVQEQYALSDSKTAAPTSGWSTAYTPTAGKYLWTRNVYTWNGGSAITSTAQCVGYFAKDGTNGTSFTPKGVAVAHCANYAAATACDKTEGDIIIVDSASAFPASKCSSSSVIKAAPSIAHYINAPDYTWDVQPADTGDAYRVGTSLWVNNGSAWVDFGDIQGPQGEAGEDALNVVVNNTTVAFTWSSGHPFDGDFQTVTLKVMKGTVYLTPGTDYTVEATAYTNYLSGTVSGIKSGDGYLINIYGQLIATNTFTKQSIVDKTKTETYEYPMSTAAVVLTVKETATGKTANVTINITVDMTLLYGGLEWTQANLASTYGELTTVGNRVTTCESSIVQNAKSITSNVSALREATHTNLFGFNKGVAFEGEGTKLFFIQAYGVYYTGGSWYRIRNLGFNGTGGDFTMRCKVYSSAAVTITFDICDTNASEGSVYIPAGTWTTVTRTFSNVSGYCNADGYNGFFDTQVSNIAAQITIADLSIERGTVAPTECTICTEDAQAFGKDYRNIEWDALYPTQKQTETVNSGSADVYYGYVGSTATGVYEDILYKNGMTSAGDSKVYTLSFWARADQQGMCITSYLYGNGNNPSGGVSYEKSLSGGGSQTVQNVADGATNTYVTTEWKKYYVHWRTINGSNFNIIPFRIVGNLNANHSGGRIFMAGAVFEEGYICDDNYASASSFSKIQQTADSIALKVKETGIDIENKKMTLTADNFVVKNNSNEEVLHSDTDGNLVVSGTVYANDGEFSGAVHATSGSFKDATMNNVTATNFTLQSGRIACFDFTSSYIGVAAGDTGYNTMHLSDNILIMNGESGRQAVFGPGSGDIYSTRVLARLKDTVQGCRGKVGMALNLEDASVTGDDVINDAIQIGGGCISGLNLRTEYINTSGKTIDKYSNAVLLATDNDMTVYMPNFGKDVKYAGHVIMIKRWGSKTPKLVCQGANAFAFQEGLVAQENSSMKWNGCSATFVYFPFVTSGNYTGIWVEWRGVHAQ